MIIFCFVLLSFYFSHPPHNRKYPCAPLLSAPQKAKKKVPCGGGSVSGGATSVSLKKKRRVHRPSFYETHSFGFLLDFVFQNCPRYARVTMACFHSPPAHALGACRDGAAQNRWRAACGARRVVTDGRTAWRPPTLAANRADGSGPPSALGGATGTSDAMAHGMDGVGRN